MATYRIDRINKEFLRLISEMLQTRIKRAEAAEAVPAWHRRAERILPAWRRP